MGPSVRLLSLRAAPEEMDNPVIHTNRIDHIHFGKMWISGDKAARIKEGKTQISKNIDRTFFHGTKTKTEKKFNICVKI